jgi:hypothetical protein
MRMARRAGAVAAVAVAFTAVALAPARAADPGPPVQIPAGLGEPVVTHPVQGPVDHPAGEVCPFATHADFPVSDLTLRTWEDGTGKPVFSVESGPLVMKVTNLANGKSVVRDIGGTGTLTYPDADDEVLSGNDWSAGFHTGDRPVHNRWIVAYGYMSVRLTTVDGVTTRTLLKLTGPYEDLCRTLA